MSTGHHHDFPKAIRNRKKHRGRVERYGHDEGCDMQGRVSRYHNPNNPHHLRQYGLVPSLGDEFHYDKEYPSNDDSLSFVSSTSDIAGDLGPTRLNQNKISASTFLQGHEEQIDRINLAQGFNSNSSDFLPENSGELAIIL